MMPFAVTLAALVVGCVAAFGTRVGGLASRAPLASVLLSVVAASVAGGVAAWSSGRSPEPAASEANPALEQLAGDLRRKLGPEAADSSSPAARPAGDLRDLTRGLAEKLKRDPGNGDGWALLARSYANIGQFQEAEAAFEKAAGLITPDAALFADWAEARVMAHDGKWDTQSRKLLQRALALDPKNEKAMALAAAAKGAPAAAKAQPQAVADSSVSGRIVLDPAVHPSADATVFVFAKDAGGGGGPPIAVKRLSVRDLPAAFRMDDGDAMVAGRNLSASREVLVSARLSNSGNAMPQSGDVQSNTVRVKVGARGIELRIGGADGQN